MACGALLQTNVFAVGDSGNIRKYDGSTWSAMTSGTTKRLRDVWGTAANNVIAVGEDGTIRKYNGTSWGSMTSNTTLTLQGVWGSSGNKCICRWRGQGKSNWQRYCSKI